MCGTPRPGYLHLRPSGGDRGLLCRAGRIIETGLKNGTVTVLEDGEPYEIGLIRYVGEPDQRFQEDGLRVMRALRFGAVFGYEIESQTSQTIHENRHMLEHVAAEWINVEQCKLLVGANVGEILRQYPDVFC